MEIIDGKITNVTPKGITIFAPYANIDRLCLRRYDEVQVGLPDGRRISPEQRRKVYALLGEIAEWAGYEVEEIKLVQKREFMQRHLQALEKELFSLSDCDMTTAREFITYLIDFVLEFDVPTHVPLVTLCDDIQRYVYACLVRKKCAVCGKRAELHHVDRVGMGNDRTKIEHIGRKALPLCRIHHIEVDHRGDAAFATLYHLEAVQIDEKIAKIYKLRSKKNENTV